MITLRIKNFNNFSKNFNDNNLQIIYNDFIYSLDLSEIKCCCGHCKWHIHAYYFRILIYYALRNNLEVVRIKCCYCHKTHVLLPIFIIPYISKSIFEFDFEDNEVDFIKLLVKNQLNWIIYFPT